MMGLAICLCVRIYPELEAEPLIGIVSPEPVCPARLGVSGAVHVRFVQSISGYRQAAEAAFTGRVKPFWLTICISNCSVALELCDQEIQVEDRPTSRSP